MSKITGYNPLTGTPVGGDWLPIVDVTDFSMAGTGTTKKISAAALGALRIINIQNPAYSGGADPTGANDSTAAIQAALNAAATAGTTAGVPAVVYIPGGDYLTSADLTYSGATPLIIKGDTTAGRNGRKAGASTIRMNFAPGHAFKISSPCPYFRLVDVDIAVDGTNSGGPTADYVGIYTSGVNYVLIERSQISKNTGNFSVNSAIRVINALYAIVRGCQLYSEVNGFWQDGGAGVFLEDLQLGVTEGNNFGAIRMDNTLGTGAATIQMYNITTFRGDWGFYAGGSGNTPLFVYMNNIQINNPRKGGIYFQAGSQFWGDYVWISMSGTPSGHNTTGIFLDTGWQGWFYLFNSVIQSPSNHGILLSAGQGFVINGVSFGGCGNAANNTYDDLHISAAASNVTVADCHFDTDKFNGIAANKARSAIYVEAGVTGVDAHNNMMAPSGYGTGPVTNLALAASVRFHQNPGYNPVGAVTAPTLGASPSTLTNTTGADCTVVVGGGTVSAVSLNGVATGLTSGQFLVDAGGTITVTYTAAPSLTWIGH